MRLDGGGRRVCKVSIYGAVAVVHRADKAAWSTLLLSTSSAFTLEAVVAGLVRIGVAEASAVAATGLIARIIRALTIAIAELFLPSLSTAILLLASGLKILRGLGLERLRLGAVGLYGADRLPCCLFACRLGVLRRICAFVFPFAATTTATLGLPHAVWYVLPGKLCVPILLGR